MVMGMGPRMIPAVGSQRDFTGCVCAGAGPHVPAEQFSRSRSGTPHKCIANTYEGHPTNLKKKVSPKNPYRMALHGKIILVK